MADGFGTATQAALRAALIADAGVAALVGDRVVDAPVEGLAFPYVRFGDIEPRADDTDGARGAAVSVGLEAHSRPGAGRIEAARIMEAIEAALHRRPEALGFTAHTCSEIEVQAWTVRRASDAASYVGTLALEVWLDA